MDKKLNCDFFFFFELDWSDFTIYELPISAPDQKSYPKYQIDSQNW